MQLLLLSRGFLLLGLQLLIGRGQSGLDVLSRLKTGAFEFDRVGGQLVLGVVGALHFDLETRDKSGKSEMLFPEDALWLSDLCVVGKEDGDFAGIRLDVHRGSTAAINHTLDLFLS